MMQLFFTRLLSQIMTIIIHFFCREDVHGLQAWEGRLRPKDCFVDCKWISLELFLWSINDGHHKMNPFFIRLDTLIILNSGFKFDGIRNK